MHIASDTRRLDSGLLLGIAVVGLVVGALGARDPAFAVVVAMLATFLAFTATRPILAAVVSLPALYAFQSVGVGGGLGFSDAALVAAAMLSLPALAHSAALHGLSVANRAFAAYVLLLLPSLLANPSAAAGREVVHRAILVLGAALIGAWLVHEHAATPALRLLVLASMLMSIASIEVTIATGFDAAQPFGYNKNYAGSLLTLTLLTVLCAPDHVRLPPLLRLPTIALLTAGSLACQSRGALLGAAAGGLVWLLAPRQTFGLKSARNRIAAIALAATFTAYASYSVQQQLTSKDSTTNSAGVRVNVERYTRELWRTSPVVGIGIRYFTTRDYGPLGQDPNNVFDAELAEAGLVGTAGFVLLHGTVLLALWRRRRSQLGLAALAVVAAQLLHGQFDIYWSSGISPLPFLLAGMALAAVPAVGPTDD